MFINLINFFSFYRLESETSCCGVIGPEDYNSTNVQLPMPVSCCVKPPSSATALPAANATVSPTPVPTCGTSGVEGGDHIPLHHTTGCDERLLAYLRSTASLLAILGYCVLAFLKMCFLGKYHINIRYFRKN